MLVSEDYLLSYFYFVSLFNMHNCTWFYRHISGLRPLLLTFKWKKQLILCHAQFVFGGLVSEWLACWLRRRRAWVQIAAATLSGNSLRQTAHTHRASVHQAAKSVAALLRVARVTAGLAKSNGSLPPGLWLTSPAGWLPRTGISSGTLRSAILYLFV